MTALADVKCVKERETLLLSKIQNRKIKKTQPNKQRKQQKRKEE